MEKKRATEKIKVPSKDPKKPEDKEPKGPEKDYIDTNHGQTAEESEEDRLLREKLETNAKKITQAKKKDMKLFNSALETLSVEIQTATGSMTAVPKPLKYLRPFYDDFKAFYQNNSSLPKDFLRKFADMLSVLAMTMAEEGSREMLSFKLEGNRTELGVWGHEFVRALCGEMSQEYSSFDESTADVESKKEVLKELSRNIVPFLIHQNTETEAVDLLFEVENLEFFLQGDFINESNYERTCLYLLKFAEYLFQAEDLKTVLTTTFELYLRCGDLPNALRTALKMNDKAKIETVFSSKYGENEEQDVMMKKQLGFILGSHKNFSYEAEEDYVEECVNNEFLGKYFLKLAENLNMQEAKSPEDVYKTHLYENEDVSEAQDATKNFPATYVNAFVNCGFEYDSLMQKKDPTPQEREGPSWVVRNKPKGKLAATASIGLINLWSPNVGSNALNDWISDVQELPCVSGALLGLGITSCGLGSSAEVALSLIQSKVEEDSEQTEEDEFKVCACLGVGLAFAGNPNEGALEFLTGILGDDETESLTARSFAALAIGLMYVGTGDSAAASEISQHVLGFDDEDFEGPVLKFFLLGWALIYLGKQNLEDKDERENLKAQLEAVTAIENAQLGFFGKVLFDACAYAGSGNVIHVQQMLHLCAQHLSEEGFTAEEAAERKEQEAKEQEGEEKEEEEEGGKEAEDEEKPFDKEKTAKHATRQAMAVLGVALITFADPVGKQMAERTFQHLLQYGDLAIRRAVPLAMALVRISDPEYGQIDVLSKLSHDADKVTAMNAVFALGLMSAGTTNSRVAQLLRQLAVFYKSDKDVLFVVRIAQGLLFAGKGLVTLHPFHSDGSLMINSSVAAILTVMVACLEIESTILGEYHMLLFALAAAIRPRMCLTLVRPEGNVPESEYDHVKVKVRVGQAVETVGQAGNPKKITGFQTHETPVLLNVGERVELATDEYEPYTSTLEGIVLLRRVPQEK